MDDSKDRNRSPHALPQPQQPPQSTRKKSACARGSFNSDSHRVSLSMRAKTSRAIASCSASGNRARAVNALVISAFIGESSTSRLALSRRTCSTSQTTKKPPRIAPGRLSYLALPTPLRGAGRKRCVCWRFRRSWLLLATALRGAGRKHIFVCATDSLAGSRPVARLLTYPCRPFRPCHPCRRACRRRRLHCALGLRRCQLRW